MGGHLFITRGDLRHLACDAILVPSGLANGRRGHVQEQWRDLVGASSDGSVPGVVEQSDWLVRPVRADAKWPVPAIWLGHTGDPTHSSEDDAKVLVEFVRHAAQTTSHHPAVTSEGSLQPHRPLLAVPLVGTGLGGRRAVKGEVVMGLVAALLEAVDRHDADVVLVAFDASGYSAAQQARHRLRPVSVALSPESTERMELVIEAARHHRLVLFLGAGVSIGAGMPSWSELLERLSDLAGLSSSLRARSSRLDSRDVATVIGLALAGGQRSLQETVSEEIGSWISRAPDGCPRVSLTHQLLAALPVTEAITTNYDPLFEQAWRDAGRDPAVLPRDVANRRREWLLKLHGTIDEPATIVLSRDDYLRFEGQSSALAGIVQAMLLTRHLLFVGYSLSDDNFHRMVHQVRGIAVSRWEESVRVGTVLKPEPPDVLDQIWSPEIKFVSSAEGAAHPDVRRQTILLDHLAAATASPAAHLLDDTYSSIFTADELAVRDAVRVLIDRADSAEVRSALRQEVREAVSRFGGRLEVRD